MNLNRSVHLCLAVTFTFKARPRPWLIAFFTFFTALVNCGRLFYKSALPKARSLRPLLCLLCRDIIFFAYSYYTGMWYYILYGKGASLGLFHRRIAVVYRCSFDRGEEML